MDNAIDSKELFLSLYNRLEYEYKCIVLNTFRCLAEYEDSLKKGYKTYNISGTINFYQKKKGYTDQQVCDKVNNIIASTNKKIFFDIDTYRKIKYRNTQSSKHKTNWLTLIAKALEFEPDEYHKYLTPEAVNDILDLVVQHSSEVN